MDNPLINGKAELRAILRESRALCWAVALFSFFINLLMLTGPLYMLSIYDRVLQSRSVETLVTLTLLVAFLFAIMATLDFVRGRIMTRVGARFQDRLDRNVFDATLSARRHPNAGIVAATGLHDLDAVHRLITSPATTAMFDMPWVPLFFLAIFAFHPLLGLMGLSGALFFLTGAVLTQIRLQPPLQRAKAAAATAAQTNQQARQHNDHLPALGMRTAVRDRWHSARIAALSATVAAGDIAVSFTAITKAFRLFLQSAMLGLGAYLVLQSQVSPGAMIAASILLGRALAPVEVIMGQWPTVQRGREGWRNLTKLCDLTQIVQVNTPLPRPRARMSLDQVTVIPPGAQQATLRMISLDVEAGQTVGVIGASGSGKTSLARALTGIWQPSAGAILLDDAPLKQYDPDALGRYIGYLPQQVQLFDGTIRDNIARLAVNPDHALVVQSAKKAAVHDLITKLPDGYDTDVTGTDACLSGGQIQRIGLARALYADPIVLVLDEPNANLDHDGTKALNAVIRDFKAGGGIVFITSHRPISLQHCDLVLVLENGVKRAFGPRDKILADLVQNHSQIHTLLQPAGLS